MRKDSRGRAIVKLAFWSVALAIVVGFAITTYTTGQLARMYFSTAKADGYAINDKMFADATPDQPALLQIVNVSEITGLQAVPVKAGDKVPENTTGIISSKVVEDGKRVALEGGVLKVMIPEEATTSSGITTKETFRFQNIETSLLGAVWNLGTVLILGLCLGMFAESVTDVMGIKITKSAHAH